MDTPLHSGLRHLELWWVVGPGMLSFLLVLFVFVFSERIRSWLGVRGPVAE